MTSPRARPKPLTSPVLRIQLATRSATGRHRVHRFGTTSPSRDVVAVIASALVVGIFITVCEWAAYHLLFQSAWDAAFAIVEGAPRSLKTLLFINLMIGVFALQSARWAERRTGSGLQGAMISALATTFTFWIIPTAIMAVMGLLPKPLLVVAPVLGLVAGGGAAVLGFLLYRKLRRLPTTG